MTGPRSTLVWVAALAATYTIDGKNYGPQDEPVQVPQSLAVALGLKEIDEPATASAEDVKDLEDILKANHGLKAELDKAHEALQKVTGQRDQGDERAAALSGELTQAKEAHAAEVATLQADLDTAQARITELEAQPARSGLPEDAHARLIALKGIGDALAEQIIAALTASGTSEPAQQ